MVKFDKIQVGDVVEINTVGVVREARGLIAEVGAKEPGRIFIISDLAIHCPLPFTKERPLPFTKEQCKNLGICLRNVGRNFFCFTRAESIKRIVSKVN